MKRSLTPVLLRLVRSSFYCSEIFAAWVSWSRWYRRPGKFAIVHADLISGLSQKEIVADYMQQCAHADGIISTRPNLIRRAKSIGLFAILRIFIIDSMALDSLFRLKPADMADVIELLPGVIPKVIRSAWDATHLPLIVGGLIEDKKDVMAALSAGAIGVSTSKETLWNA